jgi:type I restriction enzyme S subunit
MDFDSVLGSHPMSELIKEFCPAGVLFKKIGSFANCLSGATPSTQNSAYWSDGTIPWMSSGEVNKGIIFQTDIKISSRGFDSCSTKMIPSGAVVMALAGQGKTRGMVARTRIELCTNQSLCSIVCSSDVSSDYLYHLLRSRYQSLRQTSSGEGGRGGLNLQMIREYVVPVPPIHIQEQIVFVLDKLDALANDLNIGLPAEIAARRKQYEYYRDKLLTFKELDAE